MKWLMLLLLLPTSSWAGESGQVVRPYNECIEVIHGYKLCDNIIRELVKSGEVCRVIGHRWEPGCSVGPGCTVLHTNPMRHCVICGKEQYQEVGPWQ